MSQTKGRVTIPTNLDVVPETIELMKRWGADAIRDCDGTEFPEELTKTGAKIYATYYTTRKDNEWAKANPDEIQQVLGLAVSDVIERVGRNGKAIRARFPLRRPAHDAEHALDDIVDVRKVALAVSVVENLNCFAGAELVGEAEIGHIRSAGGAVDGKKAQAGTGDVVEFGVGVRQKLVRFFGRGIERDGIIHLVLGCIWNF